MVDDLKNHFFGSRDIRAGLVSHINTRISLLHYTYHRPFEFIMNHRRHIFRLRMIRAASQMPFLLSLSIIILFLRMPYVLFAHFNVEPECIFCISRIFQACTCAYVACVCVSVCCVRTTVQHLVLQLIVEDKKKKEKKKENECTKRKEASHFVHIYASLDERSLH